MVRVSERSGLGVEGAFASVKWVADRGLWNATGAPKVEEELSWVTGDQEVPEMVGGRVEGPGETEDSTEGSRGWEAPGAPRNGPSGSRGEDEVRAASGPGDAVCTLDRFVLRISCRSWNMGLAGDADGDPWQELQLTGTSVSPRGLRAALTRSP